MKCGGGVVEDSVNGTSSDGSRASGGSIARYSRGPGMAPLEAPQILLVYSLLAHDGAISTSEHTRAAESLCNLQSAFRVDMPIDKSSQIKLICVITSLLRRITKLRTERELSSGRWSSTADDAEYFADTMTLAFVSVAIADVMARSGVPVDPDAALKDLTTTMKRTLWSELSRASNKRRIEPAEGVDDIERQRILTEEVIDRKFIVCEDSSAWSTVIHEPGACAGAALRVAGGMVSSASAGDLPRFKELAFVFARNTIAQMQTQMLKSSDDRDFLTLSTRHFVAAVSGGRDEELMAIVLAGESEAGQSCLRDLLVSFLLPKDVVGVRRTLLLSRETSARVAAEFPWVAGAAHETAMMGCENVWKNSSSELKRACALLAGFAMLSTTGSGDDLIRKSTAFNGYVQLPFLECPVPSLQAAGEGPSKLLALVPSTRSWVIYGLGSSGTPSVELSKRGLEGLCMALLSFSKCITTRRYVAPDWVSGL